MDVCVRFFFLETLWRIASKKKVRCALGVTAVADAVGVGAGVGGTASALRPRRGDGEPGLLTSPEEPSLAAW